MEYSLADVHFTWGSQLFSGTADDAISIEFNEPLVTLARGGDGKNMTTVRNNDDSARVTLRLKQSSPLNDVLSAAAAETLLTGIRKQPFQLKDGLGTTLLNAPRMWIANRPAVGFGKEAGTREWVFETDSLKGTIGGANPQ